uniref:Uncharacterized protein n=1 Tax=Anguilla anguilla TaxID=7936 RepID=A0A0E9XGP3_ANGAN
MIYLTNTFQHLSNVSLQIRYCPLQLTIDYSTDLAVFCLTDAY